VKVGVNAVFMTEGAGGTGTYVTELVAALIAAGSDLELTVFTGREAPPEFRHADWAAEVRWVDFPKGPASRWNTLEVLLAIPPLALARRLDLVHSPAGIGPLRVPRVTRVVTLHDLIWLHEAERVGLPARARLVTRTLAFAAARDARRVITGAEEAARDIAATVGIPRTKIDVVPHGVRARARAEPAPEPELRARLGLGDGRVVLAVAQRRPYKNLDALVRALPGLPSDIVLVLAGAPGPAELALRALASELGVAQRVVIPDWLPAADLEGLYALATCFALPSFMEGFGLPVLEAMLRGVPVACSGQSALAEVAGDAALLFDPSEQAQITAALERLLADAGLRADLVKRGRARAAEFTWERTARATLASWRRALSR